MNNKPLITFFGTYLSESRGSKSVGETLAGALVQRGYKVELVSQIPSPYLRGIDSLYRSISCQSDLAIIDVFSTRVLHLTKLVASLLQFKSLPTITVLRGGALLENYPKIENLLTPVLQNSKRIVSPSGFLSKGFSEKGYQVTRIGNPVDLKRFIYLKRNFPTKIVRLLWVRAFTEIYRPHWALKVVEHLRRIGISSRLTMVGPDNGLLGDCMALAEQLGINDLVNFVGPVPNEKLIQYYHSHDFFLNTTKFESFGVALIEAAAGGLPIVSADVGEVSHMWKNNHDIFLVPGRSSFEFAERIGHLLSLPDGANLYQKVSELACAKTNDFCLTNILPKWESLIKSVCKGD